AVFLALGVGFTLVGGVALLGAGYGVRITFDKLSETVTLEKMLLLRSQTRQHAIYGVSHVHIETNPEIKLYGLFLQLRSGERIPIGTLPEEDVETVDAIRRTVSSFLR
ncbi:MAG: hypothetical protein H7Y11_12170, partial [Armatimonadetes bacterium]|nr:hypothetical protein [Anaerolineae bacterium]